MLITRADYSVAKDLLADDNMYVFRACLKDSGRDAVVGSGSWSASGFAADDPVTADGPFVLMTHSVGSKFGDRLGAVFTVDARTGRRHRFAFQRGGCDVGTEECSIDGPAFPTRGKPSVITSSGAPAWVRDDVLVASTHRARSSSSTAARSRTFAPTATRPELPARPGRAFCNALPMLTVALAALACTPGTAELDRTANQGVVITRVVACDANRRTRVLRRAVSRNGVGTVVQDVQPAGGSIVWSEVTRSSSQRVGRILRVGINSRRLFLRRVVARSTQAFLISVGATKDGTVAWLVDTDGEDRLNLQHRTGRPVPVARETGIRDMGIHYDATLVWKDGTGGQRYRDVRRRKTTGCAPRRKEVVTLSTPGVLLTADSATRGVHAACLRDTGVKLGIYLSASGVRTQPVGVDRHWVILSETPRGTSGCAGESVVVIDLRQGGRYLGTRRANCDGPRAGQPVRVDDQGPVLHWTRDGVEHRAAL